MWLSNKAPDGSATASAGAADAADPATLNWLQALLGRPPRLPELYRNALTHRSAQSDNTERLEFLGDAVLGLVMAEELYRRFEDADEGSLSRLRARLVRSSTLAQVGADIGIGAVLRLGSGELRAGGFRRESILADATEALFGAIYLEEGLEAARQLILRLFAGHIEALRADSGLKDAKTMLQEMLQGRGEGLPSYLLESAVGEPHEQVFTVRCQAQLADQAPALAALGSGSSRRRAEQQAAAAVLAQLERYWRT